MEPIISPMQVLMMIAKIMLYIVFVSVLGVNIIMVLMPFMGVISEKWNLAVIRTMVEQTPIWGRFLMSIIAISFWVIAIKIGKFKNIITGLKFVCIYFLAYIFIGGLISDVLRKYATSNIFIAYPLFTLIFGMPIFYLIYLFIKKPKTQKADKFPTKKTSSNTENFTFKTKLGNIILENPFRGIYVQGGAGSGKSASVFEPIIKQIAQQEYTGILYDFKSPELTNKVRANYKNSKVAFKNVDFKNPHQSDRINPIAPEYLTKSVIAIEYSQALVNNLIPESIKKADFWSNNTKMIIAGVIWWLKEEHPQHCTIPHVISLLLHTDIKLLLLKISQNYESGGMVSSLRQSLENEAQNQVAGILSTIQTAISQLNSKDVFWILSKNDIDLGLNNPEKPTFLCLGNDSTLPKVYAPIISLIISVGIRQMNKPDQQKSVVLLDEAPTIYIPNIEQIPATARSNKIATIFGVQDFSQLVDNYGQDKAQIIISNLGNQFYGRVTNGKTAEMVKVLFSKEDRMFINQNTGTGSSGKVIHTQSTQSRSESETIQERDRVKVNDLVNLNPGEFFGIIAEGSPKEFLKTQFLEDLAESEIDSKIPVSDREMSDNYFRIIEESKNLLN